KKHDALSVNDTEETLELAEESRLKMHAKQNDLIAKEKKVDIAPIDYVALNNLSKHFVKHFVPQKQLSTEQAFWLPISKPVSEIPPVQPEPVLKKTFAIKEKELLLENDRLLELLISQDLVHTTVNSLAEILDYKTQLKNNSISILKDHIATLKGKGVSEGAKSKTTSKVIALGMYKLDLEPLSSKFLRNREAHVAYLKHTQEHADTLRDIVEHART
ncbi:hypothetical protein Tco_1197339, partial [Tanacetum coccineum]